MEDEEDGDGERDPSPPDRAPEDIRDGAVPVQSVPGEAGALTDSNYCIFRLKDGYDIYGRVVAVDIDHGAVKIDGALILKDHGGGYHLLSKFMPFQDDYGLTVLSVSEIMATATMSPVAERYYKASRDHSRMVMSPEFDKNLNRSCEGLISSTFVQTLPDRIRHLPYGAQDLINAHARILADFTPDGKPN